MLFRLLLFEWQCCSRPVDAYFLLIKAAESARIDIEENKSSILACFPSPPGTQRMYLGGFTIFPGTDTRYKQEFQYFQEHIKFVRRGLEHVQAQNEPAWAFGQYKC